MTVNGSVSEANAETLLIPYTIEIALQGVPLLQTQQQLDAICKRAKQMPTKFQDQATGETESWLTGCCVKSREGHVSIRHWFYSADEPALTGIDLAVQVAVAVPDTHVSRFTVKLFARTTHRPAEDNDHGEATSPDGETFSIDHSWRPTKDAIMRDTFGLPYEYEATVSIMNYGPNPSEERLLGITFTLLDKMNERIKTPTAQELRTMAIAHLEHAINLHDDQDVYRAEAQYLLAQKLIQQAQAITHEDDFGHHDLNENLAQAIERQLDCFNAEWQNGLTTAQRATVDPAFRQEMERVDQFNKTARATAFIEAGLVA